MKVYVAMRGCYENEYVTGVFSTLENAMAAHSTPERSDYISREGGWQKGDDGWDNGLDWDEKVVITEYVLDEAEAAPREDVQLSEHRPLETPG